MGKMVRSPSSDNEAHSSRIDIFLITSGKSGYHYTLDLLLKPVIQIDDFGRIDAITLHGFHSSLLACGDSAGLIRLINTRQRATLVKDIRCWDLLTAISMNEKFVLAGTCRGGVSLFDHNGNEMHRLIAGNDPVRSVSIRGCELLAATGSAIYSWELRGPGEPLASKFYPIKPGADVIWACFNPFELTGSYLIGTACHWPRWERKFRPILRKEYGLGDTEYLLSVRRSIWGGIWGSLVMCARDLRSSQPIRRVYLGRNETPQMLWLGPSRLFAIYPERNRVMKAEFGIDGTGVHSPYLESVSLDVSNA